MAVDRCTTLSIVRHLSHDCIIYGTGTGTRGRKIRARSQVSHTMISSFTYAGNTMPRHFNKKFLHTVRF